MSQSLADKQKNSPLQQLKRSRANARRHKVILRFLEKVRDNPDMSPEQKREVAIKVRELLEQLETA